MTPIKKAYLQLHAAVFIFGFTAIIGKLISIGHFNLVWHRMWITALVFMLLPKFGSALRTLKKADILKFVGIGILVAVHWFTFYGSIKIGDSASLTLACFGLTAMFTSLLEPVIHKRKFSFLEIILGLLALTGIVIITMSNPEQEKNMGNYEKAIVWGVFSTFIAALFSTLNAKYISGKDSRAVAFVELSSGWLFLSLLLPLIGLQSFVFIPSWADIIWILILAVVCTNLAFVLNLNAMKYVSAFTANLAINLEPVYGILLAAMIFKEHNNLNLSFYIGSGIILLGVFLHPVLKRKLGNVNK